MIPAPFVQRLPTPAASDMTATRPAWMASSPCARRRSGESSDDIIGLHIDNLRLHRQPVMREPDAPGAQIGANFLVLDRIEAIIFFDLPGLRIPGHALCLRGGSATRKRLLTMVRNRPYASPGRVLRAVKWSNSARRRR